TRRQGDESSSQQRYRRQGNRASHTVSSYVSATEAQIQEVAVVVKGYMEEDNKFRWGPSKSVARSMPRYGDPLTEKYRQRCPQVGMKSRRRARTIEERH
ncbi:hypothetical protein KI387_024108, partial [Taxus chinensis]